MVKSCELTISASIRLKSKSRTQRFQSTKAVSTPVVLDNDAGAVSAASFCNDTRSSQGSQHSSPAPCGCLRVGNQCAKSAQRGNHVHFRERRDCHVTSHLWYSYLCTRGVTTPTWAKNHREIALVFGDPRKTYPRETACVDYRSCDRISLSSSSCVPSCRVLQDRPAARRIVIYLTSNMDINGFKLENLACQAL